MKRIVSQFKEKSQNHRMSSDVFIDWEDSENKIKEMLNRKEGALKSDSKVQRKRLAEACYEGRFEELKELIESGVSLSFKEDSFPYGLNEEPLSICLSRGFFEGFQYLMNHGVVEAMKKNNRWDERCWVLSLIDPSDEKVSDLRKDPLMFLKRIWSELNDYEKKQLFYKAFHLNSDNASSLRNLGWRWMYEQDSTGQWWDLPMINAFLFNKSSYNNQWDDVLTRVLSLVDEKKDDENFQRDFIGLSSLWEWGLIWNRVEVFSFCKKNKIPWSSKVGQLKLNSTDSSEKILMRLSAFQWLIEQGFVSRLSSNHVKTLAHAIEKVTQPGWESSWVECVKEVRRRSLKIDSMALWWKVMEEDSLHMAGLLSEHQISFEPIKNYSLLSKSFSNNGLNFLPKEWYFFDNKKAIYYLNENKVDLGLLGGVFENGSWNLLMSLVVKNPELIKDIESEPIYCHLFLKYLGQEFHYERENDLYKCLRLLKKMNMDMNAIKTLKGENPLSVLMTSKSSWGKFYRWASLNPAWLHQPMSDLFSTLVIDRMSLFFDDKKVAQVQQLILSKVIKKGPLKKEELVTGSKVNDSSGTPSKRGSSKPLRL